MFAALILIFVFGIENPELSAHYGSSDRLLQLLCVFQGTPGTIQWYLNEAPISTSSGEYGIEYHIGNRTSHVLVSTLFSDRDPLQLLGDYKCELTANIVEETNGWKTQCKHRYRKEIKVIFL